MVNRRRTKKYNRKKSLRSSLIKSLKRKNSKRKYRKIVRKNKKRTRKIKQSGGSTRALAPVAGSRQTGTTFNELRSKINAKYPGNLLEIGFDTSHFERTHLDKTGQSIGKLLIMFNTQVGTFLKRSSVYTTIYTGDVHWDKNDHTFIHVYFLDPDDETVVFYRAFSLSDFSVVTAVDNTNVEDYDEKNPTDSVYVLSMGLHSGQNDFKILVTEDSRQNFNEFISYVNQQAHEIKLELEYIKLTRGLGQDKKTNVSGFKLNSDGLSFQLDDTTESISLDDISDFEWEDNAVTVKLHSAMSFQDTQTDNIKFKFTKGNERGAKLFVVEKGKQMKLAKEV